MRATFDIMVGSRDAVARGRGLKPTKVEAVFVAGKWFAHETLFDGTESYTVSHIPSGLAVADRMTKQKAVELVRALSMVLDLELLDAKQHEPIARREVALVGGRFLKRGES